MFIFLFIASLIGFLYFAFMYLKIKMNVDTIIKSEEEFKSKNLELTSQLNSLQKFKGVLDADLALTKIKEEYSHIEEEVKRIRDDSKQNSLQEYKKTKEECEKQINEARHSYRKILSDAEIEAKKIAGSAFEAMKKAELLENTAKAMKNIIEGYGDQYIIPTTNLIDKLADEYSHTNAGEELKKIRAHVKLMVKDGHAAACDYVEASRKETAIDFVLDAFNGKVDSILSLVKDDNFGTLSQKIKDAYTVVNFNGAAFRNARIRDEYLNLRLEELKYASMVQALKEKEKEEQKRIREQIREEEKAVKEYERALKEAQKEEESVTKAMEKVRKDLESANEQKRQFYEEKLKELEQKLKEAEEKNKRAQSMAELTKSGHVYIISNIGSFGDDVLKIGMTRRLDPQDRVDELGDASVPFEFDVHAMIYSEDAPALEKELHRKFSERQVNKVNARKEFFFINVSELKSTIEAMGILVHWTMAAEAKEYRESLSISNVSKKAA